MEALVAAYRTGAIILLNTVLLLVVLELVLGLAAIPYHARKYDRMVRDNWPALQRAFPQYSQSDVAALIAEDMQVARFDYAPWIQFRAPDLSGRFVNTARQRRSTGAAGWATATPDAAHLDVYFLGGSTMFGFGVADSDTLPAVFQRLAPAAWRARAFNYGQPYYYSRQETLLFEQLLRSGHRPDVAVFMDGLNETIQQTASYLREPFFTPLLARRMSSPLDWQSALLDLNISRALRKLGLVPDPTEGANLYYKPPPDVSSAQVARAIAEGYLENLQFTQGLCVTYKVRCLFVWQPVPMRHYRDPRDTLSNQMPSAMTTAVYEAIGATRRDNLLDLQAALQGFPGQAYVDAYHYAPAANELLARRVIDVLQADAGKSP